MVTTMENILKALEELNIDDENVLSNDAWDKFEDFILNSLVPERVIGQDRPCEKKDFKEFLPYIENNMNFLKSFVTKLFSVWNGARKTKLKLKKSSIVLLVSLCGEHMEECVWSSELCRSYAKEMLDKVCKICGSSDLRSILVKGNNDIQMDGLFKPILLSLRPKLLKETWKSYPAAVACFYWLLPHVKSPHLSDHLNSVLPTALILVDDFIPQNRLLGVNSLHHIVDNVPRTQLCWYGQAEVVYQAIFKIVYHKDEMLAEPVLACLLLLVDKLESGPEAEEHKLDWTRRDDTLQLVMQQLELEQRLSLRRAYAHALPSLVQSLGPAAARHARALSRILVACFEAALYDHHDATAHALQVVHLLCAQCAPRIPVHAPSLASALLRLLADVHGAGPSPPSAATAALAGPALDALRVLLVTTPRLGALLARGLLPLPAAATTPSLAEALELVLTPFADGKDAIIVDVAAESECQSSALM